TVGVPAGDGLIAATIILAGIAYPLGLYALARRLAPDTPLVAGFAALLAPLLPLFPYKPIAWGGIPLIAGMAIVPGAVWLAVEAIDSGQRARMALAAFAFAAVFATHTSEIPLLVALTVAAVLAVRSLRSLATWRAVRT